MCQALTFIYIKPAIAKHRLRMGKHFKNITDARLANTIIIQNKALSGAPVAQWVKPCLADQAVLSSIPRGRNRFNCKLGSIAHSLSLSPFHHPDITELLLKRM